MNAAAASSELPTPYDATQQMCRAALAKVLAMAVAAAEVAELLVDMERGALRVLADAAMVAAQGVLAAPDSLEAAIEAGRVADVNDAARDGIVVRMASVMETHRKAIRIVRQTAALAMRVEQPLRPQRDARETGDLRVASAPGKPRVRPPNEAERLDDYERLIEPELDDEIGERPAEAIIRDICRDLEALAAPGMEGFGPEAVQAILARARLVEWPAERSDGQTGGRNGGTGAGVAPEAGREPET